MANTIKHKRSTTQGSVPSTSSLEFGEIAINTYDGVIFIKKDNGTSSVVAIGTGVGVSEGDKGDITVSNSGLTWTVDSGAITYAKIQNVSATDKILGRFNSGAGSMEEISCTSAGRALLDDFDASAQRATLGLGTLATQSGTFSGTSSGTNTGDQTITLTGDVTGSGAGSFVATIGNSKITYAKIQDVSATDKILGRSSVGAGVVEEIACTAAGRALLDDVDASAQRTTLGLGTLATQSGTFSGTSSGTNTGDQNLFSTIAVSGQSDVVADSTTDTLTLVAGSNVTITTNATTDTITIAASGLSDGDKGDITVSGSGATWTIDSQAVAYSKIQNVSATDKILGRSTAGAGTIEEIECTAAGRALLDDADATAQRTTLGLGTLATQSGTFSGTSSGTNTGDQNLFSTIAVSGQSDVVAGSTTDTLTLVAGSNITLTTNATTDTITIASSGGGISSLNALTAGTQTFATGTTGTDFNISSGTSTHTFNIPDASASARGLITTGAQTFSGDKTYAGDIFFSTNNTYDVGSTTSHALNVYTYNVGSGDSTGLNLKSSNTTRVAISDSKVQTTYNAITSSEVNASVQTTDATQTSLYTLTLADNTTYTFDVSVSCRRSSTVAMGLYGKLRFTVYRNNAGAATLAADFGGFIKEMDTYGTSGYDFTVDVSTNDVRIRVTGAASQTVNWAANIRYVQVT